MILNKEIILHQKTNNILLSTEFSNFVSIISNIFHVSLNISIEEESNVFSFVVNKEYQCLVNLYLIKGNSLFTYTLISYTEEDIQGYNCSKNNLILNITEDVEKNSKNKMKKNNMKKDPVINIIDIIKSINTVVCFNRNQAF